MPATDANRLWAKTVAGPNGCILWIGAKSRDGYGRVAYQGRLHQVHRLAYEWLVGPIPPGLLMDHLCRVRNCVNHWHLEPVTSGENSRRSPIIGRNPRSHGNAWKNRKSLDGGDS